MWSIGLPKALEGGGFVKRERHGWADVTLLLSEGKKKSPSSCGGKRQRRKTYINTKTHPVKKKRRPGLQLKCRRKKEQREPAVWVELYGVCLLIYEDEASETAAPRFYAYKQKDKQNREDVFFRKARASYVLYARSVSLFKLAILPSWKSKPESLPLFYCIQFFKENLASSANLSSFVAAPFIITNE